MSSSPAVSAVVLADRVPGAAVRDVTLILLYAVGIGLSAQVAIALPFTPVPITGQTFAVLLGAASLGRTRALFGSSLYLFAGLAGVPWFAAASPVTLGYIFGFVAAASGVGWLAERDWDRTGLLTAAAFAIGNLIIYAIGVPYLAVAAGMDAGQAVRLGLVPFLVGDALKIAAAVAVLPAAWRALDSRDHHHHHHRRSGGRPS